ncbi:Gar1-domain-containing protein [Aspergillus uvarum CBS 121591]|uniref:H/ACA ribonucleoprotein complex subunit n=1 Tax=Aspergillus uvarum CBS 121591 TaxID=1448315 RepID=A0A319CI52_9EURO|nr:Gar1-domain-containing protein [Aspergillus uvarum CBS 121591]PYH84140.1 Gar1-domain-containing protein [Aspergillus uvarum CBS 121591]
MSFRGRGTGANRGGSFGGRGGRGGFQQPVGPPAQVLEMGTVMHACEGEMVCESINPKIPYFNAPIYLENKTPIGKVDEVLGPINQVYFTVKPQEGIVATSFKAGDKVYIGGDKLLPLEKYVPSQAQAPTGSCQAQESRRCWSWWCWWSRWPWWLRSQRSWWSSRWWFRWWQRWVPTIDSVCLT